MSRLGITSVTLAAVLIAGGAPSAAAQLTQAQAQAIAQKTAQAVNTGQPDPSIATDDDISITAYGIATGRSQVNDLIGRVKQLGANVEYTVTKVENLPGNSAAIAVGTFHVTYTNNPATKAADGNFLQVLVKDGQDWKTKAMSTTRVTQPSVMGATKQ